jgi:hypothetical protein
MTDSNGNGWAVKVPRRHQGIPAGVAEAASGREPTSLEAIERAAIAAIRSDPWRAWEWVQFGETPLPANVVTQKVATNPRRGPMDAAEIASVKKTVFDTPSWRACKPERFKGGKIIPAERPTVFDSEEEAQATLERFHRLGSQAAVPLAGHLQYGVVCPLSEWEATAGQPSVDREQEELQAEVELERAKVQQRQLKQYVEELLARLNGRSEPVEQVPVPADPDEKREAILQAIAAGEPQIEVARRFDVSDRTVRRYQRQAEAEQPLVTPPGQVIDPALLGEDA